MSRPTHPKAVAVVTGCSSGIGQALAETLAARGIIVVATARKVESLAHLTKKHDNIVPLALELADLDSLEAFRDTVAAATGGRVDILINNAGSHYAATAADLDIAEVQRLFTVNVFAVMRLCQLFLPFLRSSRIGGRIVQIGSVTRDVPVVWQCAYNASKAALSQYTRTLRLEVQPFGVDVVEVVTGYVQSNILHHGLVAPPDSLYLPIKQEMERIKYKGNRNGMPARLYAESVVDKILRTGHPSSEIWEGKLAWVLGFVVNFCPRWFSEWLFYRNFKLYKLVASTQ
ncbi:1-acyl dihydroxyacetone phosphate reductase [Microdochium trichocladiopsis]|uniref:1-acyl dihydroxyacetone phosphate reductase n=1 Tax=Microdochium trichocladiopsis TaxID=1682393 RepID=A0A9P8Y0D6_9PEZI|nr:1-acyl dihydroxyacetone phosphate reductase [Microdochium trichocladiopsis]KAH7024517.1 1-acyl dihydroxyacetone phosphate reductase [Microdochium trichocladiopsis]